MWSKSIVELGDFQNVDVKLLCSLSIYEKTRTPAALSHVVKV